MKLLEWGEGNEECPDGHMVFCTGAPVDGANDDIQASYIFLYDVACLLV